MKAEMLLGLIEKARLFDLREKIEREDEFDFHKKTLKEREELEATLSAEQKKRLQYFAVALENEMDYIHCEMESYLASFVFRLGMEMQRAFDDEDFQ